MKYLLCLSLLLSFNLSAEDLLVERIVQSKDKNFNGITRGIAVFQDILMRDHEAINEKGLIKVTGEFTPTELASTLFNEPSTTASWKKTSRSTILDRGYINDGSSNPRVPVKIQKVIDLYNSQIMGLVNGSSTYKLMIFDMDRGDHNQKGWIIFNQKVGEGLYGASSILF